MPLVSPTALRLPFLFLQAQTLHLVSAKAWRAAQRMNTSAHQRFVVPATAKLIKGEFVRGRMGTLETNPVEVVTPDEALPIPVSTDQLRSLEPSGSISITAMGVAGEKDCLLNLPQIHTQSASKIRIWNYCNTINRSPDKLLYRDTHRLTPAHSCTDDIWRVNCKAYLPKSNFELLCRREY